MKIQSKLPDTPTSIFSIMTSHAVEYNAINLAQGFPDFNGPEKLNAAVDKFIKEGKNQYAPMPGLLNLREQVAKKIQHQYQVSVDPVHEITISAGATHGINTVITALIHPGDEVIIFEPAYDSYKPSVELNKGIVRPIRLEAPNYSIDWDTLRSNINSKTKLIIVNNPNNPAAVIWSKEDFNSFIDCITDTQCFCLFDEVYEHLVFDGKQHISALEFPELRDRLIVCNSFGKSIHQTGWKTGYTVASPTITTEIRKVHQFNIFSVMTPVQYALAEFMHEHPEHFFQLPLFYEQKRDYFLKAFKDSGLEFLHCAGTYFVSAKYDTYSQENDYDFSKTFTKTYGVATIPISAFYSDNKSRNLLRLCFAKMPQTIDAAAERIRSKIRQS